MSAERQTQDFPVAFVSQGEPIPDLIEMTREDWDAAVAPLTASGRRLAYDRAISRGAALVEIGRLMLEVPSVHEVRAGARAALQAGIALPDGGEAVGAAAPPAWRQVSIRLRREQHEDLCAAAEGLGMRPGQLARMLVHNGVKRITYERRRDEGS